ncbi:MAG: 5'-methylthioadenosine/adenosylhomocysteine nucleosidase [Helicobacteraceae bacterium]|jgi:adenosylhomocysteine/aminodeoxyfutalosine nucleosidase|nr:5'-methylthioadenosine/adenosylhomocysteine nucleosidase [Helicobacteraceae bacterium]
MIGIMGAMIEEIEPILARLESVQTKTIGNNQYHTGVFQGRQVVVAYSRIGKVNAAVTACVMLHIFGVTKLLFTGVAGAISGDLKIGDLIYATKLCQHDVDITAFGHAIGHIPETDDFFTSDDELNALAIATAKELGVKLGSGVIATGDQFIASNDKKEWIAKVFDADAVEMEGASVACVCATFGARFFVLRAISDQADMDAGFNFDEFLKSSAEISAKFMLSMIAKL